MRGYESAAEVRDIGLALGGTQFDRAEAKAIGLVAEIEAHVNDLAVDGQGDGLFGGASWQGEADVIRGQEVGLVLGAPAERAVRRDLGVGLDDGGHRAVERDAGLGEEGLGVLRGLRIGGNEQGAVLGGDRSITADPTLDPVGRFVLASRDGGGSRDDAVFREHAFMMRVQARGEAGGHERIAPGFERLTQAGHDLRVGLGLILGEVLAVGQRHVEKHFLAVAEADEFPGLLQHRSL